MRGREWETQNGELWHQCSTVVQSVNLCGSRAAEGGGSSGEDGWSTTVLCVTNITHQHGLLEYCSPGV